MARPILRKKKLEDGLYELLIEADDAGEGKQFDEIVNAIVGTRFACKKMGMSAEFNEAWAAIYKRVYAQSDLLACYQFISNRL